MSAIIRRECHASLQKRAFARLLLQPIDENMIEYLAEKAARVIDSGEGNEHQDPSNQKIATYSHPNSSKSLLYGGGQRNFGWVKKHGSHDGDGDSDIPSLKGYISTVVLKSNVLVSTLMTSIVYLERLQSKIPVPTRTDAKCTTIVHQIFLAALILAAKYMSKQSSVYKHWVTYSVFRACRYRLAFTPNDIAIMEKQLSFLLNSHLEISEEDLYMHSDFFLSPICREIRQKEYDAARDYVRRQPQLHIDHVSGPNSRNRHLNSDINAPRTPQELRLLAIIKNLCNSH